MPVEVLMLNVKIDGNNYQVEEGKNLLEACLSLGFDLPYFCWHPAMGSVGACRQCAVKKFKDENDTKGKIIMSCMEPVTNGMIISIDDPEARNFRKSIIESLMLNHPHDCPVCDEGGECHLQDMTMMTGHNYRRSEKKKRTYKNQYLGPFINHEMNRCIECYRCVRFYKDYAGGKDFDVFGSHDHVYFGRHEEGMLESEFSGNLIEVCPTGVFTDKTLRQHYTRKWDLTNAPSVCHNCSVGCNIIVSERYGEVRRVMSRYNGAVNGYFICDRGRFGYSFINSDKRIKHPTVKNQDTQNTEPADDETALINLKKLLLNEKNIVGIGSPECSLETNYLLQSVVGKDNFYQGVTSIQVEMLNHCMNILNLPGVHSPSLKEIEKADAVLILGEDVQLAAPMMGLALRQASRTVPISQAVKAGIPQWHDEAQRNMSGETTPFFIIHPEKTRLDELATGRYNDDPVDLIKVLISAITGNDSETDQKRKDFSRQVLQAFQNANNPLIITGTSLENKDLLQSAEVLIREFAGHKENLMVAMVVPHCNSIGLGLLGGKSYEEMPSGELVTAIVLESGTVKNLMDEKKGLQVDKLILLDHTMSEMAGKAELVLPSGTYAETEGTLVNYEGRAQHFYKVLPPAPGITEGWQWLREMLMIKQYPGAALWQTVNDVMLSM
ncbi:MAG: NADH-quinone oxidoreductase subunit NuoG, partial [Syntrophothermus sp.]